MNPLILFCLLLLPTLLLRVAFTPQFYMATRPPIKEVARFVLETALLFVWPSALFVWGMVHLARAL